MASLKERRADLEARKAEQTRGDAYLLDDPGGILTARSREEWNALNQEEIALLREENDALRKKLAKKS